MPSLIDPRMESVIESCGRISDALCGLIWDESFSEPDFVSSSCVLQRVIRQWSSFSARLVFDEVFSIYLFC